MSFNTRDILRECLQSVQMASQGLAVETIIVDNCSRDGSPQMVRNEFSWVHVIESPENLGFGRANNLAFEAATGRYIILLNSDAFLQVDTLRISLDAMESPPHGRAGKRAACGARRRVAALGKDVSDAVPPASDYIRPGESLSTIPLLRTGRPDLGRSHGGR